MDLSDPQAVHPRYKQFQNKLFWFVLAAVMPHVVDQKRNSLAAISSFIQKNKLYQRPSRHAHGSIDLFGHGAEFKDPPR